MLAADFGDRIITEACYPDSVSIKKDSVDTASDSVSLCFAAITQREPHYFALALRCHPYVFTIKCEVGRIRFHSECPERQAVARAEHRDGGIIGVCDPNPRPVVGDGIRK